MVAAMSASAAPSDGVGGDHPAPDPPGPVTEQFKSSLAREETNPATTAAECGVEAVAGLVEAAQLVEKETMPEIEISYIQYKDETQMPLIMRLIQKDLSEPYSIYTYRYFIHNWPHLCYLAMAGPVCVGAIVCKLDIHKKVSKRGYIAMLAVDSEFRKRRIGSTLVKKAIEAMVEDDADEVVLETEITNKPALKLYENLGFVRDKRLFRYYLNGVDASRLKLWLR